MIRKTGGGGDEPDINKVTTSQAALWRNEATKWNKYMKDIEPRKIAAFNTALEDPTAKFQSTIKSAVYDKYSPDKVFTNTKPGVSPNTKQFMGGAAGLGTALAGADVQGAEIAKDYKAKTLSDIAANIMGERTAQTQGLSSLAQGETQSYLNTINTNNNIDDMWSQANSSALGAIATGAYSGVSDKVKGVSK